MQIYFGVKRNSVGHCSDNYGCKLAADKLPAANGLARQSEDVFFLSNQFRGEIRVLERQADDSLVVTDLITHGACPSRRSAVFHRVRANAR